MTNNKACPGPKQLYFNRVTFEYRESKQSNAEDLWESIRLPRERWNDPNVMRFICNPHTKSGLPAVRIR